MLPTYGGCAMITAKETDNGGKEREMKRLTSLLLCLLLLTTLAVPVCAMEGNTEATIPNTPCAHEWTLTGETPATCTSAGVKSYACSLCPETKSEPVDKIPHKFDALQKMDESKHLLVCSVCKAAGQESFHVWTDGDIIIPATCIQTGTRKLVCACGASGTKVEPKGAHVYDHDCDTTCNVCDAVRTTTHTYDNACDPDCNACGEKRTTSHSYGSSWSRDHSGHWHECTKCGEKVDFRSHYPGPAATEDAPQLCLTCDYVITQQKEHQHNYGKKWSQDESGHWYECATCDVKKDFAKHVYDSDCDTHCNVCDYENPQAHEYGNSWQMDDSKHWSVCQVCNKKSEAEPHIPGAEATELQPQLCTVCGYEMNAVQEHVHAFGPDWMYDGKSHWQSCACGEQTVPAPHHWDDGTKNKDKTVTYVCEECQAEKTEEAAGFPWWVLILFVLLGAGGGVAAYIYYVLPQKQIGKFAAK